MLQDTSDVKDFLEKMGELESEEADALSQLRHGLAHGYRLKSKKKEKGKSPVEFFFRVSSDKRSALTAIRCLEAEKGLFEVNVWGLKELFLSSIKRYEDALGINHELRAKFHVCMRSIGEIQISK